MSEQRRPLIAIAAIALVLVLAGLIVAVRWPKEPPASPPPIPPAQPATSAKRGVSCPELAGLNPALVDLPVETLESQLVTGLGLPPTNARQYLESIKASLVAYAPEKRECMYRVMLIGARGSAAAVRRVPGTWGLDRPSAEIARLFLDLPLQKQLDRAQREDLLAQVDENVIPHLQAQTDGDREYWKRLYYGLLLTCEADDATLHKLEAQRPTGCLHFVPREVARDGGAPPVGGPLPREVIGKVIHEGFNDVRRCYEAADEAASWNGGKVTVRIVIAAGGPVESASIADGTTSNDERLNRCVVDAVKRMRFPPAPGPTSVLVPFNPKLAGPPEE